VDQRTHGGFLTRVLAEMLCELVSATDADGDGFVTWSEFFHRLRMEANAVFLLARDVASGPYKEDGIREYTGQSAAHF